MVAVTKGAEYESPEGIRAKASRGLTVVMSTSAWADYEVPGSPFFALIDGGAGRRIGEGAGNQFAQIADLVGRSMVDASRPDGSGAAGSAAGPRASVVPAGWA